MVKGKRYKIDDAKGYGITVFEEEDGKKSLAIQYSMHKDKIPEIKNDYLNININRKSIIALSNAVNEIIEIEGPENFKASLDGIKVVNTF